MLEVVAEMAAASEGLGSNLQLQEKDGGAVKQCLAAAGGPRIGWGLTDKITSIVERVLLFPSRGVVVSSCLPPWELVTGWGGRPGLGSFLPAAQEVAGCFQSLNREPGLREARQKLKAQWVSHSTMVAKIQHFPLCLR